MQTLYTTTHSYCYFLKQQQQQVTQNDITAVRSVSTPAATPILAPVDISESFGLAAPSVVTSEVTSEVAEVAEVASSSQSLLSSMKSNSTPNTSVAFTVTITKCCPFCREVDPIVPLL